MTIDPTLTEIEMQIAEAARKSRVARKLSAWAPMVAKALVAAWMLAMLYELHEIRRYTDYAGSNDGMATYYLQRLAKRLAPGY